jgi:hypothetical protein
VGQLGEPVGLRTGRLIGGGSGAHFPTTHSA